MPPPWSAAGSARRRPFVRYVFALTLVIAGIAAFSWHRQLERDEALREWIDSIRGGAHEEEEERERGVRPGQPNEAMRWRMQAMRDQNGYVDPDGLMRAKAHVDAMRAAQPEGPMEAGISSGSWTSVGPGNYGGRVRAMVFDPTDATGNTMFIGSVSGGIWKTTNGGASWTPLADFMANLAVTSLVISQDGLTLYASTGEGFFNADGIRGAGIFKSTNGGANWTQLASTSSSPTAPLTAADFHYVNRLARSPDGSRLLAAGILGPTVTVTPPSFTGAAGLYLSVDSGATFTKGAGIPNTFVEGGGLTDVDFHPTDSMKAVASGYQGQAYYTTDGGANWTAATGLPTLAQPAAYRVELAYATDNPSIIYASVDVNQGSVYKSANGGQSYSLVFDGAAAPANGKLLNFQGSYDNVIWVNPSDANMVVVGGVDLNRSTDGGVTFSRISAWMDGFSAHADHHVIVAHPGFNNGANKIVYFGNDGGIYRNADISTAGGTPCTATFHGCEVGWSHLNTNLAITQFYGAAGHPATGRIVGGTQDNFTIRYDPSLPNAANAWEFQAGGDGGFAAYDPVDPDLAYGEYIGAQIHRTAPGGNNGHAFITCFNPLTGESLKPNALTDAGVAAPFIAPFILDPNNSDRLLVGTVRLWRTNNAKASIGPSFDCTDGSGNPAGPDWFVIKPALGGGTQFVSAVAVANGNADIVYVGYANGKIDKTVNGTAVSPTWAVVDDNGGANPLPNRMITRITVDPSDPSGQTVYATLGGFNSDNIWRSVNGGTNWTNIHTGLPSVPVRDLDVSPANSQWLYAATEVGIFTSENAGTSWFLPHDGPANVSVDELFFMGTRIVAVTHGRGLFAANTDPSNDAPTVSAIANQHTYLSTPKPVPFTVGDGGDGDLNSLIITGKSATGATVAISGSGANRTATVTPQTGSLVTQTIRIYVSDGTHVATTSFDLTVTSPQPPTIVGTIPNQTGSVGVPLTVNVTVADPDTPVEELTLDAHVGGDPAVLPQANVVVGGTGANRTVTMTPTGPGTTNLAVRPFDPQGLTMNIPVGFTLTVTGPGGSQPPFITAIADVTTALGPQVDVTFNIGDPDSPIASLVLSAASSNPAVLPVSGVVFGGSGQGRSATLTPIAAGTTTVTFTVTDPGGLSAQQSFTLTVTGSTVPFLNAAVVDRPNVTLSWLPPTSGPAPTAYTVVASLSASGPVIASLPMALATSVTVQAPDGTFFVRVLAATSAGTVSSNEITVVVSLGPPPTAPLNLAANVTGNTFLITWSPPANASAAPVQTYIIEAGSGPGLSNLANFPTGSAATQFPTPVVPNGSYYIRVRARSAGGIGPASAEIRVIVGPPPPGAPILSGSVGAGRTVTITWTAPTTGAAVTGYVLQAGTGPGLSNAAVLTLAPTQLSLVAPGVPPGTYYVRVIATSAVGLGFASNEITLVVP